MRVTLTVTLSLALALALTLTLTLTPTPTSAGTAAGYVVLLTSLPLLTTKYSSTASSKYCSLPTTQAAPALSEHEPDTGLRRDEVGKLARTSS